MTKKGFLKNDNEIMLPITRGELVLDSSGQQAFHSGQFLANENRHGLMSKDDKINIKNIIEKTNDLDTNELNSAINSIKNEYLKSVEVDNNKLTITNQSDNKINFYNTIYTFESGTDGSFTVKENGGNSQIITVGGTLTDEKVGQKNVTDNKEYRILLSNSNNDNDEVAPSNKSGKLLFNPSTGTLTATVFKGNKFEGKVNWDNIDNKPITFVPETHNHSTDEIFISNNYKISENSESIDSNDALTEALGKLEYKANLGEDAWDWINSTISDTDDNNTDIDRLKEIFDVLKGIKETDVITSIIGKYLPLSGGELSLNTAQIERPGSSTFWYSGRSNAMIKINSYSGYNAIASMKTTNGDWSMGVYSDDKLYFSYVTDTNFNNKNNVTTAQIIFDSNGLITGNLDGTSTYANYLKYQNTVTDLDKFFTLGSMQVATFTSQNSNNTNYVGFSDGIILSFPYNNILENYGYQIAMDDDFGTMSIRNKAGGIWKRWQKVLTSVDGILTMPKSEIHLWDDTTTSSHRLTLKSVSDVGRIYTHTGSVYGTTYIGHDGTNGIVVTADQNVGIGTADPSEKLQIEGNARAISYYITGTANNITAMLSSDTTDNIYLSVNNKALLVCNSTDEAIRSSYNLKNEINLGTDIIRWNTIYGITGNFGIKDKKSGISTAIADRLILTPPGHTGGKWCIGIDDTNSFFSKLYFKYKDSANTYTDIGIQSDKIITCNGNIIWHAGNDGIGSGLDADLLDGTHKSGLFTAISSSSTTNLSITVGDTTKSVTDLYSTYLSNAYSSRPTTLSPGITGDGTMIQFKNTSSCTDSDKPGDGHVLHFNWDNAGGWDSQILITNVGTLYARGMETAKTWGSWKTILDSSNFESFVSNKYLPLKGGIMLGSIITPANDNEGIWPATNNFGQIGSSSKRFYRMYATTFNGNLNGSYIELSSATPYIDFHYNSSSTDYTSRIIEQSNYLHIIGKPVRNSSFYTYVALSSSYNSSDAPTFVIDCNSVKDYTFLTIAITLYSNYTGIYGHNITVQLKNLYISASYILRLTVKLYNSSKTYWNSSQATTVTICNDKGSSDKITYTIPITRTFSNNVMSIGSGCYWIIPTDSGIASLATLS